MSTVDTSSWNPDPDLNESLEGIPLNSEARIDQTWQALRILMAAGGLHGLQLVPFTGATASADGKQGLVPAPEAGDQDKVLKGDGTWGALSASDVPNIDASKITSGTIDIARLPAGALERLVTVANQAARFALTTADVQLGDTVKQLDTGAMYIVVDTSKLGQAAGYVEYTAGSAASVPWSGVTGKPSTFTPSSHAHGNVTNDGKLGTASRAVVTDANKNLSVSNVTATELGFLSGVTSAVQTQLDGKLSLSGGTLSGNLYNRDGFSHINSVITKGVSTNYAAYYSFSNRDRNGELLSTVALEYTATKANKISLVCCDAHNDTATASTSIAVGYDGNGNWYTYAPTPATADSSTKIATTAFVKSQGYITSSGSITGNAATATAFASAKTVTLTGDVTGSTSSTAGWSIATTVGAITTSQIAAMFENDGVDPDDPPMTYPERAVLCGDGAWRYFEQIPFPN